MNIVQPQSTIDAARDLAALGAQLGAAPEAASLRPVGLGGLMIGSGVLDGIADVVAEVRWPVGDVVLFADVRPMFGADAEVKAMVEARVAASGLTVRRVTVGDHSAHARADAATLDEATAASAGASVLLSVGSGTVVDLAKTISTRLDGVPHVAVQTAASVNGFSDDLSVLLVDGVKHTTLTRWVDRLVIDTDVIAHAPAELNRAGLGDLLATYTAPADWLLARLVGQDDSYSQAAVDLSRLHLHNVVAQAGAIDRGDPEAIDDLCAALTLSGISMGVVGHTAPASGMEHAVSHLIEMAEQPGERTPLHGAKVGALTVLSAMLWARVRVVARAGRLHGLRFPSEDEMEPRVRAAFDDIDPSGQVGQSCWEGYSRKLARWNDARAELETLPERWPEFDAELEGALGSPELIVGALRAARAPVRLRELGIRDDVVEWALASSHLMRERFTVADLAFFMGMWETSDVHQLLIDAARLGAGL
jgi:glycerol-1-phosphate dehydrogenase [NAD(P)+]